MAFSSFARCSIFSQAKPRNPNLKDALNPQTLNPNLKDSLNPQTLNPAKRIESSSEEDEDSEDTMDQEEEETIEVDFDFFDPKPSDFHGVKLLMQRYLDTCQWALSDFVDLILAQSTVGTVVKSANNSDNNNDEDNNNNNEDNNDNNNNDDNEGEIFGVISALNLRRYFDQTCIKQLKQYLINTCKDQTLKSKLISLLGEQDKYLGLLICERFLNCPYELVLKLYDALFDEIKWAIEDEPSQELRDSYNFKNYLVVTKIFVNNSTKRKLDQEEAVIYPKEEDEILREISSWSFTFELSGDELAPPDLKNYKKMGLVMVIKAEDISKFRNKFKTLVEG